VVENDLYNTSQTIMNFEERLNELRDTVLDNHSESVDLAKPQKRSIKGAMKPQLLGSKPTILHPHVKGSDTDPRWHGRCHHFYENNSRCANTNARLYCTFCSESEKDKAAIKIFCNGHMDEHIQNCQSRA